MTVEPLYYLLIFLSVGLAAGWLAGVLVKGGGFGIIGDIVVGMIGALVAGFLFPLLGIAVLGGLLASILHAALGAVIFLLLLRMVKRA